MVTLKAMLAPVLDRPVWMALVLAVAEMALLFPLYCSWNATMLSWLWVMYRDPKSPASGSE